MGNLAGEFGGADGFVRWRLHGLRNSPGGGPADRCQQLTLFKVFEGFEARVAALRLSPDIVLQVAK